MNTAASTQPPAETPPSELDSLSVRDAEGHTSHPGTDATPKNLFFRLLLRVLRGEPRPPSILRNHTNLPVFLVLALGLSLVCNFALKQNSAQASRVLGPAATLQEAQELVARHPEDPALHSRVGELYLQQRNFKRAMFHFRESSRLSELYGGE